MAIETREEYQFVYGSIETTMGLIADTKNDPLRRGLYLSSLAADLLAIHDIQVTDESHQRMIESVRQLLISEDKMEG